MKTFFEIITGFFLFFTVLVWLFFLRWNILFAWNIYNTIKTFIIPGYLVMAWLMVWYLVANIWLRGGANETKVYTKSFIVGIVIGVVLALSYMFI